jgi:hypothetical protein
VENSLAAFNGRVEGAWLKEVRRDKLQPITSTGKLQQVLGFLCAQLINPSTSIQTQKEQTSKMRILISTNDC